MKQTIEVWIDESGNFEDNSISESASLIGGVIVKKTKFTADEAKNLIAPYKKLHSNKLDRNEFKNLIHSFLTRLENKPIEPFVIENKERLNLFDSRSTYFTIFAEGMMQLINNLYLSNPDASIILNIARRMYPDSKQTLIAEKDEDYIRRLTERIGESITLFWSPWGSKDSGCSKIKIAKVKACCYSTFTLAIYCFMDFATNVKKKKKKRPILLK